MDQKESHTRIRIFGDPILRRRAERVTEIDGRLRDLVGEMETAMDRARGLGLAAPQVGHSLALCLVNLPALDESRRSPLVLINPEVVESHGRLVHQEGCLSFPGIYAEVARPQRVGIRAVDLKGRQVELEAEELLARVFLHEIDHLNGVLFIDHLSQLKRQMLRGQLRRLSQGGKD